MEYIVTDKEMKSYDRNTIEYFGISSDVLMERAALSVVEEMKKEISLHDKRVLVMAGVGNNGGDGIAIARLLLQDDINVDVFLIGNQDKMTTETRKQIQIFEKMKGNVISKPEEFEYDIIIEALFGIGLNRAIEDPYKKWIDWMNQKNAYKIAVDMPAGIHTNDGKVMGCAFKADLTVTFAFCKRGQILYPGCLYCGRIVCKDIGICKESFLGRNPQMYSYQPDDIEKYLPKRKQEGNKGNFGKLLMIAGSEGMSGACVLAGLSAYRSGTGLIRIMTPESNRKIVQKKLPEAVLKTYNTPLKSSFQSDLKKEILWANCIMIGPGIGMDDTTEEIVNIFLKELMESTHKSIIIDADAINIISEHLKFQECLIEVSKKHSIVMTPHMGEFSRLINKPVENIKNQKIEEMKAFVEKFKVCLVCKDARTICYAGDRFYLNRSGNNGMATAGSGDVLTGIIAAFAAQGLQAFEAACLGVYVHGLAGDMACRKENAYYMMARDIVKQLKYILR